MSEEKLTEETLQMVKEAQKPSTFNLAEVIKERGYPSKEVTIYTDAEAAFSLVEIEDKMNELKEPDEELEKQAQELAERVQASKLTFVMRGVSQGVVGVVERIVEKADKLYKKPEGDEDEYATDWFKYYITSLVASNVVKVIDSNGNVDESHFEYEEMLEIRNSLPSDSWGLLVSTMQKLTLATGYFKGLTDAGFLPKS
jgi:hypothetical protein